MITLELMSLLVGVSGIEMRLCFSHCDPILDGGNFVDLRFHCIWTGPFLGPIIVWLPMFMFSHF
jgi:hypothetical protein